MKTAVTCDEQQIKEDDLSEGLPDGLASLAHRSVSQSHVPSAVPA